MRNQFLPDDPEARLARHCVRVLKRAGYEALLVGGCVRDLLLDRRPEDYDVATNASPETVMSLFPKAVPVGAKFGVVVLVKGPLQVEVATFRKESGYSDRRRPDTIEFSDAASDAQRRDFTINGLFLEPDTGEIVDHVGGVADIEGRILRAIGDPAARFSEDALRLLRAPRIASSLQFEIEPATWEAMREHRHLIGEISAERIRDELTKGLTRRFPGRYLTLLDESGLLEIVLPEVAAMKGVEQPPQFHPEGDVFTHTRLMLDLLEPDPSPTLAFATLLHDVGKPVTATVSGGRIRFNGHDKAGAEIADRICRRLMFSNEARERIVAMVARHMQYIHLADMRESTRRRFLAQEFIDEELELHRVDCASSHNSLVNHELASRKLAEMRTEQPHTLLAPPLVTGNDLIALGLRPGPRFKELLTRVHDAQLEGAVSSREAALDLLKELAAGAA